MIRSTRLSVPLYVQSKKCRIQVKVRMLVPSSKPRFESCAPLSPPAGPFSEFSLSLSICGKVACHGVNAELLRMLNCAMRCECVHFAGVRLLCWRNWHGQVGPNPSGLFVPIHTVCLAGLDSW